MHKEGLQQILGCQYRSCCFSAPWLVKKHFFVQEHAAVLLEENQQALLATAHFSTISSEHVQYVTVGIKPDTVQPVQMSSSMVS